MVGTCGSSSPWSLGTKRVACSLGNRRCIGGAFASAAAKYGSSSGTPAKCELCLTTQLCGPPILRGSRCGPSTIQFNACWLTRCEVGPLMPRYRASCALRICAPIMQASTMCTMRSDGGVCSRYAAAPMMSALGIVPRMAPVHVGLPWLATATLVAPSSWGEASDDVTLSPLVPSSTGGVPATPRLSGGSALPFRGIPHWTQSALGIGQPSADTLHAAAKTPRTRKHI